MSSRAALVLAGTINSTTIEPTPLHRRASAPLYYEMHELLEPLDLNVPVFRYLELRGSGVRRTHFGCDRTLTARRKAPK